MPRRSGPAPKPSLQVVREGNPGKRPVREQVVVPPAEFAEPDWSVQFPVPDPGGESHVPYEVVRSAAASSFCQRRASEEWRRVTPVLKASVATAYRTQFKAYISEFGLSPSARTSMPSRPDGRGDDDPFDD